MTPLRQLRAQGQAQCPARAQTYVVLPRNLPHCTNRQSRSVVQRTQVHQKVAVRQHARSVAAAAVQAPVAVAPEVGGGSPTVNGSSLMVTCPPKTVFAPYFH
jgi:hypothetical protein